jgi:sulfite reductase alpha subunit-like flavoprotein
MDTAVEENVPVNRDQQQFEATKDQSAARSHVESPMSQEEQIDRDWNRMTHPTDPGHLARLGDPVSSASWFGGPSVDFLDKENILKDSPAKYLLQNLDENKLERPDEVVLPIPSSSVAVVTKNKRVTPESHWQDVRLIELYFQHNNSKEKRKVRAGDTVTIYPKNFPEDVDWLLDRMGWIDSSSRPVSIQKSSREIKSTAVLTSARRPKGLFDLPNTTLRDLLIHNLDITAIPTRSFLDKIAHFASDENQKQRLVELTMSKHSQEFYDFVSRPRRTILEVLQEFNSVRIPAHAALDLLPVIRGRDFSIASGGYQNNGPGRHNLSLQLLVALVEYKTVIRKPRQGLCSRYLKTLPAGTALAVNISASQRPPPILDEDTRRPMIAVATGTGIAPIRSLLFHRDSYYQKGEQLLFFGGRSATTDYYFSEDWKRLGVMVVPAFSRDPFPGDGRLLDPYTNATGAGMVTEITAGSLSYNYDSGKNYVQHHIRMHAKEVCMLLEKDAFICVCGNRGRMPASVRRAFQEAIVLGGLRSTIEEAEKLLSERDVRRRPRYWLEAW